MITNIFSKNNLLANKNCLHRTIKMVHFNVYKQFLCVVFDEFALKIPHVDAILCFMGCDLFYKKNIWSFKIWNER